MAEPTVPITARLTPARYDKLQQMMQAKATSGNDIISQAIDLLATQILEQGLEK